MCAVCQWHVAQVLVAVVAVDSQPPADRHGPPQGGGRLATHALCQRGPCAHTYIPTPQGGRLATYAFSQRQGARGYWEAGPGVVPPRLAGWSAAPRLPRPGGPGPLPPLTCPCPAACNRPRAGPACSCGRGARKGGSGLRGCLPRPRVARGAGPSGHPGRSHAPGGLGGGGGRHCCLGALLGSVMEGASPARCARVRGSLQGVPGTGRRAGACSPVWTPCAGQRSRGGTRPIEAELWLKAPPAPAR